MVIIGLFNILVTDKLALLWKKLSDCHSVLSGLWTTLSKYLFFFYKGDVIKYHKLTSAASILIDTLLKEVEWFLTISLKKAEYTHM